MKKHSRSAYLLGAIIVIAIFFRFYNYANLQLWTGDDEIITATIRHIIWDKSPSLLIPNSTLGFGMGPYYFYAISIFYYLTNFNLVLVQGVASIIGVATTYMIFRCGKFIYDSNVGLVASFLYACSFLISLLDRRLWPLTPGPFLAILTVLSLAKVLKGDLKFIPVLALPIGFAFHSDLYLLVLVLSIIVCWVIFKFPIKHWYSFIFVCLLIIFALPFGVAEIRYNGAVSGPFLHTINKPFEGQGLSPGRLYSVFGMSDAINVLTRILFTKPSHFIDSQWCHGDCIYPTPMFSPFSQILVVTLLGLSLFILWRKPDKSKLIPWLVIVSFIFGMLLFNRLFRSNFSQLYFLVIMPVFLLTISPTLVALEKKLKISLPLFLLIYFFANYYTLQNSSIKYPLSKKIALVRQSISVLKEDKFAIEASQIGEIQGGGWTELYTLQKYPAVKSYWYIFTDWIYASYSLYPTQIQQTDPGKAVIFQQVGESLQTNNNVVWKQIFKDLEIVIVDTSGVKSF